MEKLYILKGRSIDGTVYAVVSNYGTLVGWTESKTAASKMTEKESVPIIAQNRGANLMREPDAMIGRLALIQV